MKLLSRKEEILLLAVWKLEGNAYGVTIREYIKQITGLTWQFGAIYSPLGRLVDNGYVESYESDPVPEPGGRRKVLYRLTREGKQALQFVKDVHASLWMNITVPASESGKKKA